MQPGLWQRRLRIPGIGRARDRISARLWPLLPGITAAIPDGTATECVSSDLTRSSASRMLGEVVIQIRRLTAFLAVLALCAGNAAGVCAGWQATPEARMACCMSGTSCPMHKSESHGSGSAHMMQAQADNCCAAASNRTESPSATASFTLLNISVLPAVVPFVVPVTAPSLQEWRAFVPLPVSPVPKHLLLSVLLV